MANSSIALILFAALIIVCSALAGFISWVHYLAASVFFFVGAYLSSASVRRKLAQIPAWKKNLVLMSTLFGAGLIWYAFFDVLSKGFR